ncbi:MAG TPA: ABC transporter substrate-binding protein [Stellaceae bacterium]|nr:ABC transporter substrate-binding protein [Stellaceae bacterium]
MREAEHGNRNRSGLWTPAMSRRDFVAQSALALGSALSAGYLARYGLTPARAASSSVFKIGVPIELTGPIAEEAEEMVHGYDLYLKQHGNKLGGAPVKLFIDDTQTTPSVAIAKTRQEIESDAADFIAGAGLALDAYAIEQVTAPAQIAFMSSIAASDDLTQRKLVPTFARANMTSSQPNLYFGAWVYKNLHHRRIAMILQDYAYGWESGGGFQYAFEKSGGKVVQKLYAPLTTTDYTPFVSQLDKSVDAIYAMLVGSNVPRFVKTYNQLGLGGKIPLLGGPDMADEDALRATGKDAVGITFVHEYSAQLPLAATRKFVSDWKQAYNGQIPSYWGESTYTMAHWIDQAITNHRKKTGMSADAVPEWVRKKPAEFIDAVVATRLPETPRGPLHMDSYHNAVMTLYMMRVDKPGHAKILASTPNASQFWIESPKEFLAHPLFSRTFPPCCTT